LKKIKTFFFLGLVLSFLFTVGCKSHKEEVDQMDQILWYKQAATAWEEALPIGNGRLGAMVFGNPSI